MTVSIKSTRLTDNEIHWLEIDQTTTWEQFITRIKTAYSIENWNEIIVEYADDEGDYVRLSSEEDFNFMVNHWNATKIMKLILRDPKQKKLGCSENNNPGNKNKQYTSPADDIYVDISGPENLINMLFGNLISPLMNGMQKNRCGYGRRCCSNNPFSYRQNSGNCCEEGGYPFYGKAYQFGPMHRTCPFSGFGNSCHGRKHRHGPCHKFSKNAFCRNNEESSSEWEGQQCNYMQNLPQFIEMIKPFIGPFIHGLSGQRQCSSASSGSKTDDNNTCGQFNIGELLKNNKPLAAMIRQWMGSMMQNQQQQQQPSSSSSSSSSSTGGNTNYNDNKNNNNDNDEEEELQKAIHESINESMKKEEGKKNDEEEKEKIPESSQNESNNNNNNNENTNIPPFFGGMNWNNRNPEAMRNMLGQIISNVGPMIQPFMQQFAQGNNINADDADNNNTNNNNNNNTESTDGPIYFSQPPSSDNK